MAKPSTPAPFLSTARSLEGAGQNSVAAGPTDPLSPPAKPVPVRTSAQAMRQAGKAAVAASSRKPGVELEREAEQAEARVQEPAQPSSSFSEAAPTSGGLSSAMVMGPELSSAAGSMAAEPMLIAQAPATGVVEASSASAATSATTTGAAASAGTSAAAVSASWALPAAAAVTAAAAVGSGGASQAVLAAQAPGAPLLALSTSDAATVTFKVTLPEGKAVGDSIQLFLNGTAKGSPVVVDSTKLAAGYVDVVLNKSDLASGAQQLTAKVTNSASLVGPASTELSITYNADNSVSDGYVMGAKVYVDLNDNGVIDLSGPNADLFVGETDANGNFSALLTAAQMTHSLLASGGIDVSTGLAYQGMLKAAPGSTVLNPLTTLVQEMASQSLSAGASAEERAAATAAAQQTLIQALNLPTTITDLGKMDLLKIGVAGNSSDAVSQSQALDMQAKAVMVANLVRTGAAAIEGASSGGTTTDSASKFVFQGLVQSLKTAAETGQAIDFADADTVGNMMTAAVNTAQSGGGVAIDTETVTASISVAKTALANVNQVITLAVGTAAANAEGTGPDKATGIAQAMTDMLKAQVVAQQSIAGSLTSGDTGTLAGLGSVSSIVDAAKSVDTGSLKLTKDVVASTTTAPADTAAPTVLRVGMGAPKLNYAEGDLLVFEVAFNEGVLVTGSASMGFKIGTADRTATYSKALSIGGVLRLTYQVQGADLGNVTMPSSLAVSGSITDLAGNALALVSNAVDVASKVVAPPSAPAVLPPTFTSNSSDTQAPTLTITSSQSGTATGDVTFTFTFSEPVMGFTAADVQILGEASKGLFTRNADGKTYTLVVKPMAGRSGSFEVKVDPNTLTDLAGNANAEVKTLTQAFDVSPPNVVQMDASSFWVKAGGQVQVSFKLSEAPGSSTAITLDDIGVTAGAGALSNLQSLGSNVYAATFTAASSLKAGDRVAVYLKPGAFKDAAGNDSLASGSLFLNVQGTFTQDFIKVGAGKTFAFANNGTSRDSTDDIQGGYTVTTADKVSMVYAPKPGLALPSNANALITDIYNAKTSAEFVTAVGKARELMDLNFGVDLGDTQDINGDGNADKGAVAALSYKPPTTAGGDVYFMAEAANVVGFQPVVLSVLPSFMTITTGKTAAFSTNGTLLNNSDDKQGTYALSDNGTSTTDGLHALEPNEKLMISVAPKPGTDLAGIANLSSLIDALKNASDAAAFTTALNNARTVVDVNFTLLLGDGADITGDTIADKGASAVLTYRGTAGGKVQLGADGDSAANTGLQPVVLTQSFVEVAAGATAAFSNNGTPLSTADDKQGRYVLTGSEKVTVSVAPFVNGVLPSNAGALLNAIKGATSFSAFVTAVTNAKAVMQVNFGVSLGDGADITGDGIADKGSFASVLSVKPTEGATKIVFQPDSASADAAALQPYVFKPADLSALMKLEVGKTFAYSNNGTQTNSNDDKQGTYTVTGQELVTLVVAPKPGVTLDLAAAKAALDAIKAADTATKFNDAVLAARNLMEVNFSISLGDGVDITGDGVADKGSGAALLYSLAGGKITFSPDTGAAANVGVQPIVLTQAFIKVPSGSKTPAYANNGTPTNFSDDKQGVYTLLGTEKVTVAVGPKSGDTQLSADAQTLLAAIGAATTVAQFATAVSAARAKVEVFFGINLGDGSDITSDGAADKGSYAPLVYTAPSDGATQLVFGGDASAAQGAALQPYVFKPASLGFMALGTGKTFAYSSNGTPTNFGDDKQGTYTVTGQEVVTLVVAPKQGTNLDLATAKAALDAIKAADTATKFNDAVLAARNLMEVNFSISLGDGVDITGDGVADRGSGAALLYSLAGGKATFSPDTGAADGAALQPLVFKPSSLGFMALGTGKTFAYSSNGTPINAGDDRQGTYTVSGQELVTLGVAPKPGVTLDLAAAKLALDTIKAADTATKFNDAVLAARNLMEVNFSISLGDGVDITGDGVSDRGSGASLLYSLVDGKITFSPDTGAAASAAVQPLLLTQDFVKVADSGSTPAYANNGTPTNFNDDKQGVYQLLGTEKVTVMVAPKSGETQLAAEAQTLLAAIGAAKTVAQFAQAVMAAEEKVELLFGINLGDGKDITGDGAADKGAYAPLVYEVPGDGATELVLAGDTEAAQGNALQPFSFTPPDFMTLGTGRTFAKSNNGTPSNANDDKQGGYILTGQEMVTVAVGPKDGVEFDVEIAQAAVAAIQAATTGEEFHTAVEDARDFMAVHFYVNLGDGLDITSDGVADKGSNAALAYRYADDTVTLSELLPPMLTPTSAAVLGANGTSLTLNFNEALGSLAGGAGRFTVTQGGSPVTVSAATVSGSTVTLTLASAIASGTAVKLAYTDLSQNDDPSSVLQDLAGNDLVSFTNLTVLNNSTVTAQAGGGGGGSVIGGGGLVDGGGSNSGNGSAGGSSSVPSSVSLTASYKSNGDLELALSSGSLTSSASIQFRALVDTTPQNSDDNASTLSAVNLQLTGTLSNGKYLVTNEALRVALNQVSIAAPGANAIGLRTLVDLDGDGSAAELQAQSSLPARWQADGPRLFNPTSSMTPALPYDSSVVTSSNTIRLTFAEPLVKDSGISGSRFAVWVNGSKLGVTGVAVDATDSRVVTLTTASAIPAGADVYFTYADIDFESNQTSGVLQSIAGGRDVGSMGATPVVNPGTFSGSDTRAPVVLTLTEKSGTYPWVFLEEGMVFMQFTESLDLFKKNLEGADVLDITKLPALSSFSVKLGTASIGVTGVGADPANKSMLMLTLDANDLEEITQDMLDSQVTSVSYTPGDNPLKDVAGNAVTAVSVQFGTGTDSARSITGVDILQSTSLLDLLVGFDGADQFVFAQGRGGTSLVTNKVGFEYTLDNGVDRVLDFGLEDVLSLPTLTPKTLNGTDEQTFKLVRGNFDFNSKVFTDSGDGTGPLALVVFDGTAGIGTSANAVMLHLTDPTSSLMVSTGEVKYQVL